MSARDSPPPRRSSTSSTSSVGSPAGRRHALVAFSAPHVHLGRLYPSAPAPPLSHTDWLDSLRIPRRNCREAETSASRAWKTRRPRPSPRLGPHSWSRSSPRTGFEASWARCPAARVPAQHRKARGYVARQSGRPWTKLPSISPSLEDTLVREVRPLGRSRRRAPVDHHGPRSWNSPSASSRVRRHSRTPTILSEASRRSYSRNPDPHFDGDNKRGNRFLLLPRAARPRSRGCEYKRLFYVAPPAPDKLFLARRTRSGKADGIAQSRLEGGRVARRGSRPHPADTTRISSRLRRPSLTPDDATRNEPLRLCGRPRVIPALKHARHRLEAGTFDGFATTPWSRPARGQLAHEAIEQWFTSEIVPALGDMARRRRQPVDKEIAAPHPWFRG